MLYSFAGFFQKADDVDHANEQIDDVYRSIWAHSYSTDFHQACAVFETDDLNKFLEELSKTINHFLQTYKEI